ILAATNNNLEQAVAEGTFREDLYFRLTVMTIASPPLRQRGEDIIHLAEHFLRLFAHHYQRPLPCLSTDAQVALLRHTWPGNVRELAHVIERAVLLGRAEVIHENALVLHQAWSGASHEHIRDAGERGTDIEFPADGLVLEEVEKTLIKKALARTQGNTSQAARLLSISRNTLRYRMEKYGLYPPSSKITRALSGPHA